MGIALFKHFSFLLFIISHFFNLQRKLIILGTNRLITFSRSREDAYGLLLESDDQKEKERA